MPSEKTPANIEKTRKQELELARTVEVIYANASLDYQPSLQRQSRTITQSVHKVTENIPIVLTDDEAAKIADIHLNNMWVERDSYILKVSNEYWYLDPSDVVTVVDDGVTYTMRIIQIDYGAFLTLNCVAEDQALYTSQNTGSAGKDISQILGLVGGTRKEYLDIPILRDNDDDAGFYIAACGYTSSWDGASIFRSLDGGLSYILTDSLVNAATIGTTTDVLADHDFALWDRVNSVNVQLTNGALYSDTEINVLNDANAILIGSEVILFVTATLESDGTYTLSGLIRGRKGTDWATGTHTVNERVVLLNTSTLIRLIDDASNIGTTYDYKAVSIGRTLQETSNASFTNNAIGLECYSPVNVVGARDGSNNLTVTWNRRSRISAQLLWDPSLGEDTESYEVDIIAGYTDLIQIRAYTPTNDFIRYDGGDYIVDGFVIGQTITVEGFTGASGINGTYVITNIHTANARLRVASIPADEWLLNDSQSIISTHRTIAVTSETASYLASEQTTDGLTPGDPVQVNVHQLSANVGRGYPRNNTR